MKIRSTDLSAEWCYRWIKGCFERSWNSQWNEKIKEVKRSKQWLMMFITSASRRYLWCSMVDGRLLTVSFIGFSKSSSTLLRILNFFLLESSMICSTWRGLWSFPIIFSTWRLGTGWYPNRDNYQERRLSLSMCNDHLWMILFYQMSSPYNLSSMWLVSIVLLNQLNWIVPTFPHPEMCVFFPIRLSTPV